MARWIMIVDDPEEPTPDRLDVAVVRCGSNIRQRTAILFSNDVPFARDPGLRSQQFEDDAVRVKGILFRVLPAGTYAKLARLMEG